MSPVEVAHDVRGDPHAPPLVLAGSLGTTRAMWQPQIEALSAHARVIAYDHRGHGDSPVPPGPYTVADLGGDVVALLDRLDIASAHVCGLSIGGLVALWLARHHPERIDRLVACATAPAFPPPEPWHERAATVRAHGVEAVADGVLARWFTDAFAEAHPDTVAALRAGLTATPAEGYAGCCEALAEADLSGELGGVTAPTLAVAGGRDPATPPQRLTEIASGVADGRLAVIDDAAHLVNLHEPERVTGLILDHLDVRPWREAP